MLATGNTNAVDATEQQIKAAYLYRFTQFVEWPATAFDAANASFQLCVLGENQLDAALAPLASRIYQNHPISIKYPIATDELRGCHLVYIASPLRDRETAILKNLSGMPVLTVSSLPRFAEQGGVIEFVQVGNHVRFVINRAACLRNGLSCSAKLLEVAIRILDENRE